MTGGGWLHTGGPPARYAFLTVAMASPIPTTSTEVCPADSEISVFGDLLFDGLECFRGAGSLDDPLGGSVAPGASVISGPDGEAVRDGVGR